MGAQAARDPDEEGDYMAFEKLMADAAIKKEKKGTKDKSAKKEEKKEDAASHYHHHHGIPSHVKEDSTARASA